MNNTYTIKGKREWDKRFFRHYLVQNKEIFEKTYAGDFQIEQSLPKIKYSKSTLDGRSIQWMTYDDVVIWQEFEKQWLNKRWGL